jgi:hypothetical protein
MDAELELEQVLAEIEGAEAVDRLLAQNEALKVLFLKERAENARLRGEQPATSRLPPPAPSDSPAIWDIVVADMQARDRFGAKKYGQRLKADDGRDPLVDAYQEALDLAAYLRKAIFERTGK